jgi:prepilin signal peptidase PulO-like enzyme (type II secretory pathway)
LGKAIFRKESMGMGDVKLLISIGVYVGFPSVALCLFFGVIAAALLILVGMILGRLRLGDTIPFGPFIAVGTMIYLLWGETLLGWYLGQF